ncbi:transposase [Janthinobacterium sp. NKUCC06_STL]|nr:transposase [Janthinobacterium sp. NKUCC06_STL]
MNRASAWGNSDGRVERTLAWLHRFRRLRIRYERRADIHQALLSLACILICWRCIQRLC